MMTHFGKTLLLVGLMLLGASGIYLKAENRYGVSDEFYDRYCYAVDHAEDSMALFVADSIYAEGIKQENEKMLFMALNIKHIFLYYQYDENFVSCAREAMRLAKKYGYDNYERIWDVIVLYYIHTDQLDLAKEELDKLNAYCKEINNEQEMFRCFLHLAVIYATTVDPRMSIEVAQEALVFAEGKDVEVLSYLTLYSTLAQMYYTLSIMDSARYYANLGAELDSNFIVKPYIEAKYSHRQGDWDGFFKHYEEAKSMSPSVHGFGPVSHYLKRLEVHKLAREGKVEEAYDLALTMGENQARAVIPILFVDANDFENAYYALRYCHDQRDSIFTEQMNDQISHARAEYETLYETKEKEKEIMRQRYIIGGTVGVIIFLIILALVVIKRNRDIAEKNRSLVANINEMLDAHQKELAMMKYVVAPVESLVSENAEKKESEETEDDVDAAARRVQYYIYQLTSRKLFCSAEFDREALLEELHLQKNGFWKDFLDVTGQNFSNYLLNLRLEYAAEQIRHHPEYTVDAIAAESGFSGRSTFYRNFSARFGITPTLFREQNIKA